MSHGKNLFALAFNQTARCCHGCSSGLYLSLFLSHLLKSKKLFVEGNVMMKISVIAGRRKRKREQTAMPFVLKKTAKLSADVEEMFVKSAWENSFLTDSGESAIPNVGEKTIEKLEKAGIRNQLQLVGKFLMFMETGSNTQARCDKFAAFLNDIGVHASLQSVITYAMAKKIDNTFPGFFISSEVVEVDESN